MEIWKTIPFGDNNYQISNLGRVKNTLSNIILKQSIAGRGYLKVALYSRGHGKQHYIHRLLAEAYLENHNSEPTVNHKDGDKTNNVLSNLEWLSYSENNKHAFLKGLKSNKSNSRPVECLKEGVVIARFASTREGARKMGCFQSNIRKVLDGEYTQTAGYFWRDTR